jgi:hypothetical protein
MNQQKQLTPADRVPVIHRYYGPDLSAAIDEYHTALKALFQDAEDVGIRYRVNVVQVMEDPTHVKPADRFVVIAVLTIDEHAMLLQDSAKFMQIANEQMERSKCDHAAGYDQNMRCRSCGAEL